MLERARNLLKCYREWREERRSERMRRFIAWSSQPKQIAAMEAWSEEEYGRLTLLDHGFRLDHKDECKYVVQWAQIAEIHTYKHDFFSHDMVCLGFRVGANEWVEAWESMAGFGEFVKRMQELFPSIRADWRTTVTYPAFAPNHMMLWKQEAAQKP